MIVKVVELGGGEAKSIAEREEAKAEKEQGRTPRALRRYWVFNTEQIDGVPQEERAEDAPAFEPIERAEGVMQALIEKTGLLVMHGDFQPCYIPSRDEIRLPRREAFNASGPAGYFGVALHEAAHSSLHERRMNRRDAIGKRWGDQAYALEELRAEICSAILGSETGVPMSEASIANHAAYLNSWVKAIEGDPMAIFTAAKDADLMAEYLLGLGAQLRAERRNDAWVRGYERAESEQLAR
jgi:antirestriction protein ArdC